MIEKLFKPRTLTWYQIGILKLVAFCFGSVMTLLFPMFFIPLVWPMIILFFVGGAYLAYVWFKQ